THMAEHGVKDAAAYLGEQSDAIRAEAESAGLVLAGIQLDYDCPTSKLATYTDLLVAWSRHTRDVERSITTLPDWTRSAAFPALVRDLDYFVLQVHSFERPTADDEDYVLCRTDRVPAWTAAAEAAHVPFYVALPTYGYEIAFDGDGRYLGLAAEGPSMHWGPNPTVRVVMARPDAMAGLVTALRDDAPRGFIGFAWFRMPVATDTLNWTWPTLRAVMDGRVPRVTYMADVRTPEPGLHEIWLSHTGGDGMPGHVGIDVSLPAGILARDTHNGFRESTGPRPGVHRLNGPGPAPGDPVLAAWYRLRNDAADMAPTVDRVETVQ
ncbi:MAG: DUF3142 domain-containing protein, partial [bacterium]|nr:DUF3142 domain-containing protein [bacterium]